MQVRRVVDVADKEHSASARKWQRSPQGEEHRLVVHVSQGGESRSIHMLPRRADLANIEVGDSQHVIGVVVMTQLLLLQRVCRLLASGTAHGTALVLIAEHKPAEVNVVAHHDDLHVR
jgi:hypothetical protein